MKNIIRGQKLSLNDLGQTFELNINWDNNNCKNYDIDSSVLLISDTGKMENEEDFIFYNNPKSKCSSISLKNSNGINSKKSFDINLNTIPNNISRMIFVLTIHEGEQLNNFFKNVKNISLNFVKNNNILIQYNLEDLNKETALILCEVYKHNNEWKIQATGSGFNSGLDEIIKQYGSTKLQVVEEVNTPNTNTAHSSTNNNEAILILDFSNNMSFKLRDGSVEYLLDKIFAINNNIKFDVFASNEEVFNTNSILESKNKNRYILDNLLNKFYLGTSLSLPTINKVLSKYSGNRKILYFLYKEPNDFQNSFNIIKNSVNNGFIWNFIYFDNFNIDKYKSNNIHFYKSDTVSFDFLLNS